MGSNAGGRKFLGGTLVTCGVPPKLRVLHALEAFAGGTERHLLDLVAHVEDAEHVIAVPSVHLGRPTIDAIVRAREIGATVELVEMTRSPAPHRNAAAITSMRSLIRRYRPDVVHGHSSLGGAISRLSATGTQVPVAYTPNGLSRATWALTAERYLRSRTDWLIAVSEGEAEFAAGKRLAPPDRISVIRNGIDLEPLAPLRPSLRARLGVAETTPLVGCLGRLTWQKAPEIYAAACGIAARRIPDAHYLLIGSGLHEDLVRAELESAGLGDRFHWLDALPGAAAAFAELDLYVLPSRFEGGPYTPLEAMRARTATVLTDVAGNSDSVEHGVTGLLVPVDEPEPLADAIVELIRDPARRAAFAAAGEERLRMLFDVREMAEQTAEVYQRLAADRRGPAKLLRRAVAAA
ncbi:MAG TPA: glycosyltransferase family 4 protein [Solirubrobacteraceae bacterium]